MNFQKDIKNESSSTDKVNSGALNLISKLKQTVVQDKIYSFDWNVGSDSPLVVEFDPTTNCNLACPDCISGSLLNQGMIERNRILDLTQEMIDAGVKAVVLIGGGEPMMHPDIGKIIEMLGKSEVKIGITTNGFYLKKHLDVTAKYADWVRVSMDAGSPETFQRIRPSKLGNSLFHNAIENMEIYAQKKSGKLGYSFMIFDEGKYGFSSQAAVKSGVTTNVYEIYEAAKIAKEIGCDYFELKPMYDVNHYAIMQKNDISDIVFEQLAKAKELEDDNFKVHIATKLKATLKGESNLEPKEYHRCAVSELRTLVTPSGVYVCPYFRGVESKKIGDVNEHSFSEMWHGEQRKRILEKLDPSVDCRMHCIRHHSNLEIEEMIKHPRSGDIENYDLFI
jgi:MoaA/NifB/PqqE/SkfB family radical SAM enzyme